MLFSRGLIRLGHKETKILLKRFYSKNSRKAMRNIEQNKILGAMVSNPLIRSTQDVNNLKKIVLNASYYFTPENINQSLIFHLIKNQQFSNVLSYIQFLDSDTKENLNLFLKNQQFLIYFLKRYKEGKLTRSEQNLLVELCQDFEDKWRVLDSSSLERLILGLSVTSKWPLSITLFDDLKKRENPSSICYAAIIAGAFINDNPNLAWTLLSELFDHHKAPHDIVFKAFFEKMSEKSEQREMLQHLDKLLGICNENNFIMNENSIIQLQKLLNDAGLKNRDTSVDKKGFCRNCNQKLDTYKISDDTFEELRRKFLDATLVGRNIFAKSTPEELLRFQNFLKTLKDCDVVIDGLNVAYIAGTRQPPQVYSTLLANVVSHFVEAGKKVCVLGRKHMNSWPTKQWSYIKNNSHLFLTENISHDDPYLLYCALHSGKNTILVSRDMMRSHLFALRNSKDKYIFSRWLEQRQFQVIHVGNEGKIIFKYPRPYTRIVQLNNKNWHIPYNIEHIDTDKNDISEGWLCVERS